MSQTYIYGELCTRDLFIYSFVPFPPSWETNTSMVSKCWFLLHKRDGNSVSPVNLRLTLPRTHTRLPGYYYFRGPSKEKCGYPTDTNPPVEGVTLLDDGSVGLMTKVKWFH